MHNKIRLPLLSTSASALRVGLHLQELKTCSSLSIAPPSDEERALSPSTRRRRERGLADELGGGAGELPARSSVSEVNGGGVFLTDVPDGQKTQRVCRPRATSCSCNLGIRVNLSRLLDFIALRS